jgi:MFS family permease
VRAPARRWLVVLALFVVTYGISTPLAAYGVFLPVLADTFGWSRGAIATALSINLLLGGVAGFVIGALADRHGPRVILVVTVATAGTAFALVATVSALWQLYLFVGVLGGVGMSSFYLLAAATVSHWLTAPRPGAGAGAIDQPRSRRAAGGVAHLPGGVAAGIRAAGQRLRADHARGQHFRSVPCPARPRAPLPGAPRRPPPPPGVPSGPRWRSRQWYGACWFRWGAPPHARFTAAVRARPGISSGSASCARRTASGR